MSNRFEISDESLLNELLQTFVRVCETFPFLKSKTASLIESAFSAHSVKLEEFTAQLK